MGLRPEFSGLREHDNASADVATVRGAVRDVVAHRDMNSCMFGVRGDGRAGEASRAAPGTKRAPGSRFFADDPARV